MNRSYVVATVFVNVPPKASVGDRFTLTGDARIVGEHQELVDVTTTGGPKEFVAGETEYVLFISNATLKPLT